MGARGLSSKSLLSFNAGELSPKLDARIDLEKYSFGCRQLQNAIVWPYGGFTRRPGLQFIAPAKNADRKARLIPFQFSRTTSFVLEFGHECVRFFSNGSQVMDGSGPYEIASPYEEADIPALQHVQINDVMYLAHPLYAPRKLSRLSDTSWTLELVDFDWPALRDQNAGAVKIAASATTGNVTLTATGSGNDIFEPGHVGSLWQLAHLRDADYEERSLLTEGASSSMRIAGDWNARSYGIWSGDLLVQRSIDSGSTWETLRKFSSADDRNVDAVGAQDGEPALYRLVFENQPSGWTLPSGAESPRAVIEATSAFEYGLARITAVGSGGTTATATVVRALHSTDATTSWSEGAWSDYRGYPAAVTIFEQRIVYGRDQTVWGSVSADYENFERGTADADSFAYTIGSQEFNGIEWLVGQDALIIGTAGGEWRMSGGMGDEPLTPTNVFVRRQSTFGSDSIQAKVVGDVVLFVQRGGRKVREFVYAFERDNYVAPDLTLLSEHITAGGIVNIAYQQQPDSILWAVTGNGKLIGMTYERDQNVVGWCRHETDGEFESVATVYGDESDEVWVIVKRMIEGAAVRYVERISPAAWEDKEDAFFVDSGLSYDGSPQTAFSGLDHLEGETVSILADGYVVPDRAVSGGSVTLDEAASVVHVGLPYETIYEPMKLDVDGSSGNTQFQMKRIRELSIRFLDSLGCQVGNGSTFDQISFRDTADLMDASPPLFSGDKTTGFNGPYDESPRLILKQDQPLPMTVIAVTPKYEVTGRK